MTSPDLALGDVAWATPAGRPRHPGRLGLRSAGVPSQTARRSLARQFDWRRTEARLNAYPQFITAIDGTTVHFVQAGRVLPVSC
jgi:hypothetical protein